MITLFLLIICTNILFAQNTPILLNQFTGGLNTRLDSGIIDIKDSQDTYNMTFDDHYTLQSRAGSVLKASMPQRGTILSSYCFNQANGKRWYVVQVDSSIFATENWSDWVGVSVNLLSTFYPCNYTIYGDRLWISNGIDYIMTWDGANVSTQTFIPKGRYIAVDSDILWICGVAGTPSTVYFSNGDDPILLNSWTGDNYVDINVDDGDIITGICIFQGRKIVFKKNGIYGISGNIKSDMFVRNYSNSWGCIDNKSIQQYKNIVLFLSADGLRSFNGSAVELVSEKIYNDLRNINQITSGGLFEWRQNKTGDFVNGTIDNVQVIDNAVQLSSMNYKWDTDIEFQTPTISSNIISNSDMIRISTADVPVEKYLPVTTWTWEEGKLGSFKNIPENFNRIYNNDIESGTCNVQLYTVTNKQDVKVGIGSVVKVDVDLGDQIVLSEGQDEIDIFAKFSPTYITKMVFDFNILETEYNSYIQVFIKNSSMVDSYTQIGNRTELSKWRRELKNLSIFNPKTLWHNISQYGTTLIPKFEYNQFQNTYNLNTFTDGIIIKLFLKPKEYNNAVQFQNFNIQEIRLYNTITSNLFKTTGTYISSIFDTKYPTPRWGTFQCFLSSPAGTSLNLYIQTSTSPTGVWSDKTSILPGQNLTDLGVASQRCLRWGTTLYSPSGTTSPSIYSVRIDAVKSTGTYISDKYNTRLVDTWHIFSVDDSTPSINYFMRSAANSTALLSATWIPITKNTTIPVSSFPKANTWVQWKSSYTTDNGAINPATYGVGIGWFTGTSVKNVASAVYNNRYYLAVSTGNDSYNNVIYIYDNNGGFTKYNDLKPATLLVDTDNKIYYGDGSVGGGFYQMEVSTICDNNTSIKTLWISKDFDFSDFPIRIKQIGVTGKCNVSTQTITISYSQGYSGTWTDKTIQLSSGTYSTEVINIADEIYTYNVKFKISGTNPVSYDIRKIAVYYDRLTETNVGKQ